MNKIIVDIRGGVAEVTSNNTEIDILIRDYDIEGNHDLGLLPKDKDGQEYIPSSGYYDPDYVEEEIAFHDRQKEE